jgi:hypothetical protein
MSGEESENKYVVDISTQNERREDEEQAATDDRRNPPLRLTYVLDGEQVEFRDLMEDSD